MAEKINTGGGSATEGNVQAGEDVVGRDNVHITHTYIDSADPDELLRVLVRRVIGDPLYGQRGLAQTVDGIEKSLSHYQSETNSRLRQTDEQLRLQQYQIWGVMVWVSVQTLGSIWLIWQMWGTL